MKCTHNDCLTCPYPDCILTRAQNTKKPKKTKDRSEYWARYYEKNKEQIKERMRKHYHNNKKKYSDYAKAKYQRDKFKGAV